MGITTKEEIVPPERDIPEEDDARHFWEAERAALYAIVVLPKDKKVTVTSKDGGITVTASWDADRIDLVRRVGSQTFVSFWELSDGRLSESGGRRSVLYCPVVE